MRKPLLVMALVAGAATAQTPKVEPARCKPGADRAAAPQEPARSRPLIEMPDARPLLTVYRQVNGCSVLLVKEGDRIIEEPVGRPEQRRVLRQ